MIILTSPEGFFYAHILKYLSAGFNAAGVETLCTTGPKNESLFNAFVHKHKPKAVFQINEPLLERGSWPNDVPHLLWLQDYRFNGKDIAKNIGKSDWFYFLIHPSAFNIHLLENQSWSMLTPGAIFSEQPRNRFTKWAKDRFFSLLSKQRTSDFSITGFIPAPLNFDNPVAKKVNRELVTLKEFLKEIPLDVLQQSGFSLKKINEAIGSACFSLNCEMLSDSKTNIIDEILPRTIDRKAITDAALIVSKNVRIIGHENWNLWPEYKPYYRGYFKDPMDLNEVYKTTRVNLHNSGLSMHFRVIDCMAAGGVIMVNETPYDDMLGGINKFFESGTHFQHYNIEYTVEVARELLKDKQKRIKMAFLGQQEVQKNHSWYNKALQIIDDIDLKIEKDRKMITDDLAEEWNLVTKILQ